MGKFKFKHIRQRSGRNAQTYILCEQCYNYLVMKEEDTKNVWPLFLYSVLFGVQENMLGEAYCNHQVCGGNNLWRLIPRTMRQWWVDEISTVDSYAACTADYPEPVFEDKTIDLSKFIENYNSDKLGRVTEAMSCEAVINCNVLCPWSCLLSCQDTGLLPFDIMI